jgi:hypothetical protein
MCRSASRRKPLNGYRGIDKATGKKVFEPTGEKDKRGNIKTFRSKKLAETDDATTFSQITVARISRRFMLGIRIS